MGAAGGAATSTGGAAGAAPQQQGAMSPAEHRRVYVAVALGILLEW
jgi:hypothetical protein